ncbi:MAG: hypothetical protein IPI68_11345 [Chitinophagaceae bacterium]|nr:hypothetical protein [Chitinophagaceae bacterium]
MARLEYSPVKKDMVYLDKLILETAIKWEKQMAEKGIQLKITVPANTIVSGDHFFLAIITDNLFNNAIKYGTENGTIYCSWNNHTKIFSIANDGQGIAQEQLPFLFNRFYRTDNSRSSEIPGSGLGLAIVKNWLIYNT